MKNNLIKLEINTDNENFNEICSMYWEVIDRNIFSCTVAKITEKFNKKSIEIRKIVNDNSCAYTEFSCNSCGSVGKQFYKSRADFLYKYSSNINHSYVCKSCLEKENEKVERERQEVIQQENIERERLENEKHTALEEECYKNKEEPFSLENLTFKHMVFLFALIRMRLSEDLNHIEPFDKDKGGKRLSPFEKYDRKIIRYLLNNGVINIRNCCFNSESIYFESELYGNELNLEKISNDLFCDLKNLVFDINVNETISIESLIIGLENELKRVNIKEKEKEVIELCKELAIQECIALLDYITQEHNMNCTFGDKTILTLNKILDKYSVSRVYVSIFSAVKNAAAYMQKEGVYGKRACNSIRGNIERHFENIESGKWSVKEGYKRNYNLPISEVSHILYEIVLKTDDGGFSKSLDQIFFPEIEKEENFEKLSNRFNIDINKLVNRKNDIDFQYCPDQNIDQEPF